MDSGEGREEARRLAEQKKEELSRPTHYSVWTGRTVTKVEMRGPIAWEVPKVIVAMRGVDEITGETVTVAYGPRGSDPIPVGVKAAWPLTEEDLSAEELEVLGRIGKRA